MDVSVSVEDRIRELRSEIQELETSEHPLAEQERRESYLAALREERAGVEGTRRRGLSLGEERETIADPFGGFTLGERTGHDLVIASELRLEAIDAEINRVTRLG